jgi:hypothetical protein
MLVLRLCCALVAVLFGATAVVACGTAVWFDLHDHNYELSILLTVFGLFAGLIAVELRKLARVKRLP